MPESERKKSYDAEYIKQNQRQYLIKINRKTEPDLLAWMEGIDQTQTYIKELIRKDMEAHKTST